MLKNLNSRQKKFLKIFILIFLFFYNIVFSVFDFFYYTAFQLLAYFVDNFTIFGLDDNHVVLFSTAELWVWFVIITSILFLAAFIAYIVLSIKSIKRNGVTKELCIKSLIFTIVYTALYTSPVIIDNFFL